MSAFPRIQGRCPTCGSRSLFLGAGGFVTCGWLECSRPDHASALLEAGPAREALLAALAESMSGGDDR